MNQDTDMNQDEGHQAELEQQEQENYGALFRALSKAQKDIVGAKKDSANPFFKSKYADLASCWDACREALTKNGLCVIQLPQRASEKIVTLQTILAHESGESISSTFSMPMKDDSPQSYGSTLTYARRYALAAIVGIAQVDDDAESGMQRTQVESSFISKQAKTKARSKLLNSAKESLDQEVRDAWNTLDNDQRAELWDSYAKADKTLITESLEKTKEAK